MCIVHNELRLGIELTLVHMHSFNVNIYVSYKSLVILSVNITKHQVIIYEFQIV